MRVNELSAMTVTVNLLESDGTAAVPSTVHWRLVCVETDATLQDWTAVTPTYTTGDDETVVETEATVEVASTLHAMQTSGKAREKKALAICADKGLSSEYNTEINYEVERLNARS